MFMMLFLSSRKKWTRLEENNADFFKGDAIKSHVKQKVIPDQLISVLEKHKRIQKRERINGGTNDAAECGSAGRILITFRS